MRERAPLVVTCYLIRISEDRAAIPGVLDRFMAAQTTVTLVDDIDASEAAEFTLDRGII